MNENRVHIYSDDDGNQIARKFINKKPDGRKFCRREQLIDGVWTKGTDKVSVPLYRAGKLLKIIPPNEYENAILFIVEGEKDVETMERLGFHATTTPAGTWKPQYDKYVQRDDLDIVILSDNDMAGEERANNIYSFVKKVNQNLRWIKPTTIYSDCPDKGDISDIVNILGDKRAVQAVWNAVSDPSCAEDMGDNIAVTCLADVQETTVKWLWYPYIPSGKITIIMGDPGMGKTTLASQISSIITNGGTFPKNQDYQPSIYTEVDNLPRTVILQNAEDGYSDTIEPRLSSAGADVNKIYFIDETADKPLSFTDVRLEQVIKRYKPAAVIIDPVQAYLGSDVDMYRANQIRPIMAHLSALADKYSVAVILIGHMNKASDKNALYRGLGSIDFVGAARSVVGVGAVERNDGCNYHRAIVHIKANLAPKGEAVLFDLNPDDGFSWKGFDGKLTEEEVMTYESPKTWQNGGASDSAKEFLLAEVKNGRQLSKVVSEKAEHRGISSATLNRAKKELGIKSQKQGDEWFYVLPDSEEISEQISL